MYIKISTFAQYRNIFLLFVPLLFLPLGHPRFQAPPLTRLYSACCSSLIPSITLWDAAEPGGNRSASPSVGSARHYCRRQWPSAVSTWPCPVSWKIYPADRCRFFHSFLTFSKNTCILRSPKVLLLDNKNKKSFLFCIVLAYSYLCTPNG